MQHDFFRKVVPNWVYFGQGEGFKLTTELSEKGQYSRNQAIKNSLNKAILLISIKLMELCFQDTTLRLSSNQDLTLYESDSNFWRAATKNTPLCGGGEEKIKTNTIIILSSSTEKTSIWEASILYLTVVFFSIKLYLKTVHISFTKYACMTNFTLYFLIIQLTWQIFSQQFQTRYQPTNEQCFI